MYVVIGKGFLCCRSFNILRLELLANKRIHFTITNEEHAYMAAGRSNAYSYTQYAAVAQVVLGNGGVFFVVVHVHNNASIF